MLRTMVQGLLDLLWPPRSECLLCRARFGEDAVAGLICGDCWNAMSFPPGFARCMHCSRPMASSAPVCGECQAGAAFGQVYALGLHDGPLREAIHHLKFGGRTELGGLLGERLALTIPERFDLVLPVPLHPRRQRGRGFNQSELLAKGIGGAIGVPVLADQLIRYRHTKTQAELDRADRLSNLADAFAVVCTDRPPWVDKSVLIVDDVLTTGATVCTVADLLWQTGARHIATAIVAVSTLKING